MYVTVMKNKNAKFFSNKHPNVNKRNPLQCHCSYIVHFEQPTDERITRIDQKLMLIDQNDRNPPNSIIKLSKALTVVSMHPNPNRPFPSHCTYTVLHIEQQTDARETAPRSWDTKEILYPINACNPILRLI